MLSDEELKKAILEKAIKAIQQFKNELGLNIATHKQPTKALIPIDGKYVEISWEKWVQMRKKEKEAKNAL